MKSSSKITIVVSIQIVLILSSFLVLAYFETQKAHHGNLVNVSGKNRFLASEIKNQVTHNLFHGNQIDGNLPGMMQLKDNLQFLKNGGTNEEIELLPMSAGYVEEWNVLWAHYNNLKSSLNMLSESDTEQEKIKKISQIVSISNNLIKDSDEMTNKIGKDLETLSTNLFVLELLLASVNIAVHIFMIIYIISIFRKESQEKIKTERFNTIGEFASNIAHDIKNPLTIINNSLQIIQKTYRSSDSLDVIKKEISRIYVSVRRIDHEVDDLLNYIKNIPLKMEQHSLLEILNNAKNTVEITEHIELSLPTEDKVIDCDETQIHVLFVNLLRNAIQSITNGPKKGEGRITVIFEKHDDNSNVKIVFENSGPLIPNDKLSNIFEPLFTTKVDGTGLGLASCKSIVRRHQGKINATSEGVVKFTILLPIKHKTP